MAYASMGAGSFGGRDIVRVPHQEFQENHYLRNCHVITEDYNSLSVIMFLSEYQEACRYHERDKQQMYPIQYYQAAYGVKTFAGTDGSGVFSAFSATGTTSIGLYGNNGSQATPYWDTEDPGNECDPNPAWSEKQEKQSEEVIQKKKKHSDNVKKLYWARKLKDKDLVL